MNRILHAVTFAEQAHRGQVRKYTGEPYIVHPLEVARIVASVVQDEDMVIAALLHDVVEDCKVELGTIEKAFGQRVAKFVSDITDVSRPQDGNRTVRKALDRAHIAAAGYESQTIKLADLISNTQSITQHDPDFAEVYMDEKRQLLDVIRKGDITLFQRAWSITKKWEREQLDAALNK